ncbi:MAG: ImmA/IrrE family metallo-endopeptidase [Usitatibacteraceae bacterium]
MQIDRVELSDCTSPERIIAEILRQVPDLPVPVPIEELAAAVGITAIHRMATENFEGGLITQPERRDGVILVNGKANRLRQRYTIGHELGHYLIAAHQPGNSGQFACSKSDMNIRKADRDNRSQRMEAEANRFSAGILMPLIKFKADMRSQGGPDLNHVVALAASYDVSKEATAIHYSSYHQDPCAIILSQNGLVRRVYKSPRFPFVEAAIGKSLPRNSLSACYQSGEAAWEQVDRGVWLAALERPSTIDEQALCLANGWKMTMLIVEDSEDDSDEEVRDTYDVWENPRFPGKSRRR